VQGLLFYYGYLSCVISGSSDRPEVTVRVLGVQMQLQKKLIVTWQRPNGRLERMSTPSSCTQCHLFISFSLPASLDRWYTLGLWPPITWQLMIQSLLNFFFNIRHTNRYNCVLFCFAVYSCTVEVQYSLASLEGCITYSTPFRFINIWRRSEVERGICYENVCPSPHAVCLSHSWFTLKRL